MTSEITSSLWREGQLCFTNTTLDGGARPYKLKLNNDRPQGQTVRTSARQGALKDIDSDRE